MKALQLEILNRYEQAIGDRHLTVTQTREAREKLAETQKQCTQAIAERRLLEERNAMLEAALQKANDKISNMERLEVVRKSLTKKGKK